MSSIKKPLHPGEFILLGYLEPLELTITSLAEKLDVSQSTLSRLINGKSDLSYDMAVRLSYVLGRSPQSWVNLQTNYSLSQVNESVDFKKLCKAIPA